MEDNSDNRYQYNSERRISEWHRLHEAEEQQYLKIINEYLSEGTLEAKEAICSLAEQDGFVETFKTRNEMSYIINAINIYYRELDAGVSPTVLDMADSVDGLIAVINKIRFLIWELEYTDDEMSGGMLCEYIRDKHISIPMLLYILDVASIDTYFVSMKLSCELEKKKMYRYQLYILLFVTERWTGDETALCELAHLYMCAGQDELAKGCLAQICHPGDLAERVRKEYGL